MNELLKDGGNYIADHWLNVAIILVVAFVARHFGGLVITRIMRRVIRRTKFNDMSDEDVKKRQNTLIGLLITVWKIMVVVIAALIIFVELFPNINLAPLFASAGIVGIALGFGAQSLIKDFLSGIFIITENQYRVGDVVDLQDGATGTVEKVGVRSTVLRDVDGNVHYIPNGIIAHVINKTMGFSKVNFSLAVDPEVDVDRLAEVINKVGDDLAADPKWGEKIIEAPHFLSIGTFSDQSLEVKISGKTQPSAQWSVTGEMRKRLLAAFRKHKIELANLQVSPIINSKK